MDGLTILIYAVIAFVILAIFLGIILYLLPAGPNYSPLSGKDSIGTWKLVSTSAGVIRSYYFRSFLSNSDGQFLTISEDHLTFGNSRTWIFDGIYLWTERSGAFLYVNVSTDNIVYLSTEINTKWLFDGFNFYLDSTIASQNFSYLNPLTLEITTVPRSEIILYEPTIPRWLMVNPVTEVSTE